MAEVLKEVSAVPMVKVQVKVVLRLAPSVVAIVVAQWALVQAASRDHGKRKECHSSNNKGNPCDQHNNCHRNYYNNHRWPHNSNSNRIYAIKGFSKGFVESLEEVRVVLLGKTLVETLVPARGRVLAVAEVMAVPPKILEGAVTDALVQPILSAVLQEDLAASPD